MRSGDFSQIAFNQTYENINLNVEVVSWNDIYTVVNTRLSGDKAPEVRPTPTPPTIPATPCRICSAAVSIIGFIILLTCASTYMLYTPRKGDDE